MSVSLAALVGFVGKPISSICQNKFCSPTQNHCAHFVSHAHDLQLGVLCGDMLFATKGTGASIRCDDLFNRLATRGTWEERPSFADGLLIFVLSAQHVRGGRMMDVPRKHVGIHFGGQVYHYSNTQGRVVVDVSVKAFHDKFKQAYRSSDVSLFYAFAP